MLYTREHLARRRGPQQRCTGARVLRTPHARSRGRLAAPPVPPRARGHRVVLGALHPLPALVPRLLLQDGCEDGRRRIPSPDGAVPRAPLGPRQIVG